VVTVGIPVRALEQFRRGAVSSLSLARSASWMLILSMAGTARLQATLKAGLDMGAGMGVQLSSSLKASLEKREERKCCTQIG
jgi:hypothetical protein